MRRPWEAGAVLGAALGMLSCGEPNITHLRWEPVTLEHIETALQEPTGSFNRIDPEIMQAIEQQIPSLAESARFVGHLATVVAEVVDVDDAVVEQLPETSPPEEKTGTSGTWSSSLFLRVACNGDQLTPPYSFNNGEVRLDSPELESLDTTSLVSGGEFLLTFRSCQMGPLTIDGAVPGRYIVDPRALGIPVAPTDPDAPRFGLALDAKNPSAQGTKGPLGVIGFACGSASSTCQSSIRVAAEFHAGEEGTYVIEMEFRRNFFTDFPDTAVTIRGADSEATCTYKGDFYNAPSLSCDSGPG